MVETEVSLLQALQHRISDRILALAQHALDLGMKYAVLDIHRQDGLICVITASYPMAEGMPKRLFITLCRWSVLPVSSPWASPAGKGYTQQGWHPAISNPDHPLTGTRHAHCH